MAFSRTCNTVLQVLSYAHHGHDTRLGMCAAGKAAIVPDAILADIARHTLAILRRRHEVSLAPADGDQV